MIEQMYIVLGSIVALTVAFVKVQMTSGENKKNIAKVELNVQNKAEKTDLNKLESVLFDRMDKFELHITNVEKNGVETTINLKLIEGEIQHIKDQNNKIISLIHDRFLGTNK